MAVSRRLGISAAPTAWRCWLQLLNTRALSTSTSPTPLSPPDIGKLLVANRGEIACRIFTTAKRLGVPTVAVFSEADRGAAHVSLADEAFCIGPAPSKDSYLRQDHILEAAIAAGATAIHPGYGFLSENASFASSCEAHNITFVGPPPSAIDAMGDKSRAKATMVSAGVPVVPGYHGEQQEDIFLEEKAKEIGFPLLVKAVMGGGGKGMKLAHSSEEFLDALHSARREAAASFGDQRVLLERFIQAPRHIEVQVLSDTHGNAYYLAERDCSVQRRHQKVIEEAPAPGIDHIFRAKLGTSAVDAAQAVQYRNAGTVEFIVDSKTGEYYFMEMNTRLQVEHPVTEAVVNLDLVELQLRVAAGESLAGILRQEDLEPKGHAFEARLYAENPWNGFLPAGGKVLRWKPPPGSSFFTFDMASSMNTSLLSASSPVSSSSSSSLSVLPKNKGCIVRVDSGVRQGDTVGVNYDPMIAKIIVKGPNRETALKGIREALGTLQVAGVPTNAEFVRRVTINEEFQAGGVDTSFITRHEKELLAPRKLHAELAALAPAVYTALDAIKKKTLHSGGKLGFGPWNIADSFRLNYTHHILVEFRHTGSGQGGDMKAEVALLDGPGSYSVETSTAGDRVNDASFGKEAEKMISNVTALKIGKDWLSAEVQGKLVGASWSLHTYVVN
jgi:3-methylcrotonyl-CoA carboxylase alpha subunit